MDVHRYTSQIVDPNLRIVDSIRTVIHGGTAIEKEWSSIVCKRHVIILNPIVVVFTPFRIPNSMPLLTSSPSSTSHTTCTNRGERVRIPPHTRSPTGKSPTQATTSEALDYSHSGWAAQNDKMTSTHGCNDTTTSTKRIERGLHL